MTVTPKHILSWGMGTQSTTLAVMSALGLMDLPKLDAVITADTGWERQATYDIRDFYTPWLEERGIPVYIVDSGKNIRANNFDHKIDIPFFTANGGPLTRECTRKFKVRPIHRKVREILGYPPDRPPHPPPGAVSQWLGISLDEFQRMKPSRVKYLVNRFPLVERRLTRYDCIKWLGDNGFPVPIKSACIGCPFRTAVEWMDMRDNAPDEWDDVCSFDRQNRHNPLAKRKKVEDGSLYVHRGLIPLEEVDLETAAEQMLERERFQVPMFLECDSGYCHV